MAKFKSRALEEAFSKSIEAAELALKNFPWKNRFAYGMWLAQTYYFVRHTPSFLGLASSRFGHWQRERQYHLLSHLREEEGHDKLALDDIKNLGFKLEDLPELPETSAFYQSQYYYIEHENPIAHLGYSLSLEGLAATKGMGIYEIVQRAHPGDVCRFLQLHAVVDKDHFQHGLEFFNDLTQKEIDMILRNLNQSSQLYIHMLNHIQRRVQNQNLSIVKVAA